MRHDQSSGLQRVRGPDVGEVGEGTASDVTRHSGSRPHSPVAVIPGERSVPGRVSSQASEASAGIFPPPLVACHREVKADPHGRSLCSLSRDDNGLAHPPPSRARYGHACRQTAPLDYRRSARPHGRIAQLASLRAARRRAACDAGTGMASSDGDPAVDSYPGRLL